jgi:hypothetical protein
VRRTTSRYLSALVIFPTVAIIWYGLFRVFRLVIRIYLSWHPGFYGLICPQFTITYKMSHRAFLLSRLWLGLQVGPGNCLTGSCFTPASHPPSGRLRRPATPLAPDRKLSNARPEMVHFDRVLNRSRHSLGCGPLERGPVLDRHYLPALWIDGCMQWAWIRRGVDDVNGAHPCHLLA